jgi:hypothetical protein
MLSKVKFKVYDQHQCEKEHYYDEVQDYYVQQLPPIDIFD